jgi:hypothetical protein
LREIIRCFIDLVLGGGYSVSWVGCFTTAIGGPAPATHATLPASFRYDVLINIPTSSDLPDCWTSSLSLSVLELRVGDIVIAILFFVVRVFVVLRHESRR